VAPAASKIAGSLSLVLYFLVYGFGHLEFGLLKLRSESWKLKAGFLERLYLVSQEPRARDPKNREWSDSCRSWNFQFPIYIFASESSVLDVRNSDFES